MYINSTELISKVKFHKRKVFTWGCLLTAQDIFSLS